MTTELFLGGLTILTMAAIIIVALTTNRTTSRSEFNRNQDRTVKQRHTPPTEF